MIEVADVFRRFAADYLSAHGASMLPSHRRAIDDILRLPHRGTRWPGLALRTCDTEMFSYHSCKQPQLSQVSHRTDPEMARSTGRRRCCRCRYFHITVTVPGRTARTCCGPISVTATAC